MKNLIKPVYIDIMGQHVADVQVHVNNGWDVSVAVIGSLALTNEASAKQFFNSLDWDAAGMSVTALMYRGDKANPDQFAGTIGKGLDGNWCINALIVDFGKFAKSGLHEVIL